MRPMILPSSLAVLISLLIGCDRSKELTNASPTLSQHTILDEVLASEDVARRVRQVEEDLPSDTWTTGPRSRPGQFNSSRDSREFALAHELIGQLKPKFKSMSARELLRSLKTFPYATIPDNFSGVAYYIYRDGNQAIIKELSTRNRSELDALRGFQDDLTEVFTGDDGPPCSIGDLVRNTLLSGPQQVINLQTNVPHNR